MTSRRHDLSLNGLWDFLPVLDEGGQNHAPPPADLPTTGWHEGMMPVPGSWTRGGSVIGADDNLDDKPWLGWRLFDSYGFPEEWDATCTAWYRRRFSRPPGEGCRWILHFGGVLRCAWVFVNGRLGRAHPPRHHARRL